METHPLGHVGDTCVSFSYQSEGYYASLVFLAVSKIGGDGHHTLIVLMPGLQSRYGWVQRHETFQTTSVMDRVRIGRTS